MFCPDGAGHISQELSDAQATVNSVFSGSRQLTLGCRLQLGVDIVRCALRDLGSEEARAEVKAMLVDMLSPTSAHLDFGGIVPGSCPSPDACAVH